MIPMDIVKAMFLTLCHFQKVLIAEKQIRKLEKRRYMYMFKHLFKKYIAMLRAARYTYLKIMINTCTPNTLYYSLYIVIPFFPLCLINTGLSVSHSKTL